MKKLLRDQRGMGLSTMIALGFAAAVVLVLIVGVIVFLVNR